MMRNRWTRKIRGGRYLLDAQAFVVAMLGYHALNQVQPRFASERKRNLAAAFDLYGKLVYFVVERHSFSLPFAQILKPLNGIKTKITSFVKKIETDFHRTVGA